MVGSRRRAVFAAALFVTLPLVSTGALAQPASKPTEPSAPASGAEAPTPAVPQLPDPNLDAYRQHMDVGISLYEQKNYVAAIVEFEEAYKARPRASPLVNIALCHKAMFAYPKAIRALTTALEKHSDTMDENDKKAANAEIEEMRALLSYVTFKVTPSQFSVRVDGEDIADAASGKPVPLSPGPHEVEVAARGHTTITEKVTLASGQRTIEYALKPNMGFVQIKAASPKYAIAIDQKALEYGEWSGLLTPGPHIIEMYVPGSTIPPYRVRLDVEVGKSYSISPGKGGVPIFGGGSTRLPPPKPKLPDPPIRGPFALATISLFLPTEQPQAFTGEDLTPGVSAGLRLGYRVNTPVSFDAMFEYSNMLVTRKNNEDITYTLQQLRGGLNMRLQTPGKTARFYGNFGGGFVWSSLDFSYPEVGGKTICETPVGVVTGSVSCDDVEGFDGDFLIEMGLQLTLGGVLVDLTVGTHLQSTRGFGPGTYRDWLPIFEGGLRVGYGFW